MKIYLSSILFLIIIYSCSSQAKPLISDNSKVSFVENDSTLIEDDSDWVKIFRYKVSETDENQFGFSDVDLDDVWDEYTELVRSSCFLNEDTLMVFDSQFSNVKYISLTQSFGEIVDVKSLKHLDFNIGRHSRLLNGTLLISDSWSNRFVMTDPYLNNPKVVNFSEKVKNDYCWFFNVNDSLYVNCSDYIYSVNDNRFYRETPSEFKRIEKNAKYAKIAADELLKNKDPELQRILSDLLSKVADSEYVNEQIQMYSVMIYDMDAKEYVLIVSKEKVRK